MDRRNPVRIAPTFGSRYPGLIPYIKFGDDRLRGLELVGSPFHIDFAGRPYNGAALPRAL